MALQIIYSQQIIKYLTEYDDTYIVVTLSKYFDFRVVVPSLGKVFVTFFSQINSTFDIQERIYCYRIYDCFGKNILLWWLKRNDAAKD